MAFRIPDEETVSSAVRTVISKNPHIETQTEFLRLVRNELSKLDGEYRVSGERIRRIGVEKGIVKISIEYRGSDAEELPDICPVCRNALSSVMNRSLEGEYVEIKRKCTVCSYSIGKTVLVPGRYSFSKAKDEVSPQDVSVRKLRKAGAKLAEACRLISEAVDGTEFEERGKELISRLEEMRGSAGASASIKNIVLDIEQGDDRPPWMKPAVSIKNSDLKDI